MTMDKSKGFEGTKEFLVDRLQDTGKFGKSMKDMKESVGFGVSLIKGVLASVLHVYGLFKTNTLSKRGFWMENKIRWIDNYFILNDTWAILLAN